MSLVYMNDIIICTKNYVIQIYMKNNRIIGAKNAYTV